jgi:hypothetical protein
MKDRLIKVSFEPLWILERKHSKKKLRKKEILK